MLYCAVYCHGKLVGGGPAGREEREGKESWRERDSREGGAEEGSIKIRWFLLSFFGLFFSFFFFLVFAMDFVGFGFVVVAAD